VDKSFVKIVSSLMRLDKENASGAEQLLYQKILLSEEKLKSGNPWSRETYFV
tara:strand:- start:558 stop:713 length:156 start_codon:yes stop_codon:yes gene_type:complete